MYVLCSDNVNGCAKNNGSMEQFLNHLRGCLLGYSSQCVSNIFLKKINYLIKISIKKQRSKKRENFASSDVNPNIYSLNKFPIYHTMVLTRVIILCIISLVLNVTPILPYDHLPPNPLLPTPLPLMTICFLWVWFSPCSANKGDHIAFVWHFTQRNVFNVDPCYHEW